MKKVIFPVLATILLGALGSAVWRAHRGDSTVGDSCEERPALSLSDAENFALDSCGGFRVLKVQNGKSAPLRWVLLDSLSPRILPENLERLPRLRVPAQRIVALSSTYLGYLEALGTAERVVAIDTKKYIADADFYRRADSLDLAEVGEGMGISPEAVYGLSADVILSFSTGSSIHDAFPKLSKLGMPVVLTSEWRERSPLSKAEWIKFFGVVVGREALAESLFSAAASRYRTLKTHLDSIPDAERPVVMTGGPTAGTWYASAGRSFSATLIRDAGGRYLWAKDTSADVLAMPLEKAFVDGRKASVWLNPGGASNLEELLGRDPRVKLFPAWESGEIYGYDLRKGPEGGLDFYESAVVKPDSLLIDVAKTLHPAGFQEIPPKWYRKLSNI